MTDIDITMVGVGDPMQFDVLLRGGDGSQTRHLVSLTRAECERRSPGENPERVIDAAFRFLLDREPKEAILARFDFSVIARYFPEFETAFADYISKP